MDDFPYISIALLLASVASLAIAFTLLKEKILKAWGIHLMAIGTTLLLHLTISFLFLYSIGSISGETLEYHRPSFSKIAYLYPHIVFFSIFLGWPILFFIWMSSEIVWKFRPGFVLWAAVLSGASGFVLTTYEHKGVGMMIFEFDKFALERVTPPLTDKDMTSFKRVEKYLVDPESAVGFSVSQQEQNRRVFSLTETWKDKEGWSSRARHLYLLIYFYITSLMVYLLLLSVAYILFDDRKPNDRDRRAFCYFALLAYGIFLLWIPCRLFYNIKVKIPVFGSTPDYFGIVFNKLFPTLAPFGVTSSEIMPLAAAVGFLFMFVTSALLRLRSARYRLYFVLVVVLGLTAVFTVIAFKNPVTFSRIMGFDDAMENIWLRFLIASLLVFFGYFLVVGSHLSERISSVYISYAWNGPPEARQKPEIVDNLCSVLEKGGWNYCIDVDYIHNGDLITDYTDQMIRAERIIAVIDRDYIRSEWCMAVELYGAWNCSDRDPKVFREKVIPLFLDGMDLTQIAIRYWEWRVQNGSLPRRLRERTREMIDSLPDMFGAMRIEKAPVGKETIQKKKFIYVRKRLTSHPGF